EILRFLEATLHNEVAVHVVDEAAVQLGERGRIGRGRTDLSGLIRERRIDRDCSHPPPRSRAASHRERRSRWAIGNSGYVCCGLGLAAGARDADVGSFEAASRNAASSRGASSSSSGGG